jgi:hypothetical protein
MARAVGSATLVFVAWLVGGVIVLFGAFCYAELGAAFPSGYPVSADAGRNSRPAFESVSMKLERGFFLGRM